MGIGFFSDGSRVASAGARSCSLVEAVCRLRTCRRGAQGLAGGAEDDKLCEVFRVCGYGFGDGVIADGDDVGGFFGGCGQGGLEAVVVVLVDGLLEGDSGLLEGTDVGRS